MTLPICWWNLSPIIHCVKHKPWNILFILTLLYTIVDPMQIFKFQGRVNNYLCTHDLYSSVHNVLDACISLYEGKWEESNPLPVTQVMDMHASKTLCTGLYNHRCISGFMQKSPEGGFRAHPYWGGWRSRCIKELVRPAQAAPPIKKLIRNQETTVRYIICACSA